MITQDTLATELLSKIDIESIGKHPNILIAARLWEDERYNAAKNCYKFMRMIDDMIDDRKAEVAQLSDMEKQLFASRINEWINDIEDLNSVHPLINEVLETVAKFKIPMQLFFNFAQSMIYDIDHDGFKTMHDFINYAEGASVAPASIFVHLCCLNKKGDQYEMYHDKVTELARPCAIFSYLVHIIRDFEKDHRENLNYFPTDLLNQNHISLDEVRAIALGAPATDNFRNVIREYYQLANGYRKQTLEIIEELKIHLPRRYLASLQLIFNLYDLVYEKIDIENGTFSTIEMNPSPDELKGTIIKTLSNTIS